MEEECKVKTFSIDFQPMIQKEISNSLEVLSKSLDHQFNEIMYNLEKLNNVHKYL